MTKSLYRGWRMLPADVHQQDVVSKLAPQPSHRGPTESPTFMRRASPVSILMPRTKHWISSLPFHVRPVLLAAEFARIANHLCATWHEPVSCRRYFQSLLIDRRGNRKGFPHGVLRELLALRSYYNSQHPTPQCAWETVAPLKR